MVLTRLFQLSLNDNTSLRSVTLTFSTSGEVLFAYAKSSDLSSDLFFICDLYSILLLLYSYFRFNLEVFRLALSKAFTAFTAFTYDRIGLQRGDRYCHFQAKWLSNRIACFRKQFYVSFYIVTS